MKSSKVCAIMTAISSFALKIDLEISIILLADPKMIIGLTEELLDHRSMFISILLHLKVYYDHTYIEESFIKLLQMKIEAGKPSIDSEHNSLIFSIFKTAVNIINLTISESFRWNRLESAPSTKISSKTFK